MAAEGVSRPAPAALGRQLRATAAAERALADAFVLVALRHAGDADVRAGGRLLSRWSADHVGALATRTGPWQPPGPAADRLRRALFRGGRWGGEGLLRDLQDLVLLATRVRLHWTVLLQCARASHDEAWEAVSRECAAETDRQLAWLDTRIRHLAAHAVLVPADRATELRAAVPSRSALASVADVARGPAAGRLLPLGAAGLVAALLGPALLGRGPAPGGVRSAARTVLAGLGLGLLALWSGRRVAALVPALPADRAGAGLGLRGDRARLARAS
jgi:hypothetical protein